MNLVESRSVQRLATIVVAAVGVVLASGTALGQCAPNSTNVTSANGSWSLNPAIATTYKTEVNAPIAADGSSTFSGKRGVVPIQFSLLSAPGPIVFQSILNGDPTVACSTLTYTPNSALSFSGLTNLSAVYTFTQGNCHAGSLRWSIIFSNGATMFIYYGADSGAWSDCTSSGTATNQSGLNMINANWDSASGDNRYETSNAPGTYVTYATASSWAANQGTISSIILVVDSGNEVLTLGNVSVNTDAFPAPTGPSAQTCELPPAQIQVYQTGGVNPVPVNDSIVQSPADSGNSFRISGCKYIYNLDVSNLGKGTYSVNAIINGAPVTDPAVFALK
jgi:hypothetical protein